MATLSRRAKHRAISVFVGLIGFSVSMAILWLAVPRPEFEPIVWDAKQGSPVPLTFAYAIFPHGTHVKLLDHPGGSPTSASSGPEICREAERESGEYLPVQTPEGRLFARMSDLTFAAGGDSGASFLSTQFRSTTPDQRIALTGQNAGSGVQHFVLRISDLKHARSMMYVWDVVNGAPSAREVRRSDIGTAINSVSFAAAIAVVSIVIGALASNMFNRRAAGA